MNTVRRRRTIARRLCVGVRSVVDSRRPRGYERLHDTDGTVPMPITGNHTGVYYFCIGLMIACLATLAPTAATTAEPTTSALAVGISLARTATSMLDGDPQSEMVAGNRQLLLGINDKLEDNKDALHSIQQSLNQLPKDFLNIMFQFEEIQKVERAEDHFQRLIQIEDDFELSTKYKELDAWRDYSNSLMALRKDLRDNLRGLGRSTNPMSMVTEAATFGLLLQVQGQIIAVEKLMLSLNDKIADKMEFSSPAGERQKLLALSQEQRVVICRKCIQTNSDTVERRSPLSVHG